MCPFGLRHAIHQGEKYEAGPIGGDCCLGNAGRDLLLQASSLTIDLTRMTLRLQ
jgi:hypothetical protein